MNEITYKMTREELGAYQRAARDRISAGTPQRWWEYRSVRWLALVVATMALVLLIDGLMMRFLGRAMELTEFFLGTLLGVAAMSSVFWILYYDHLRRMARQDGPILGEHTLRLTNEGILVTTADVETRYSWSVIEDVTDERELLLMWIEPGVAISIPRSAFDNDAQRSAFMQQIEARKSAAGLPRVGSFA